MRLTSPLAADKIETMNESKVRIGVMGLGNISGIYLKNLGAASECELAACADLDLDRAKKASSEHGIPKALSPEAMLNDPEVDLVLNLTIPNSHLDVSSAAVESGKHVYGEKPLSVEFDGAQKLISAAESKGLRVGSAPDTFLGGSHQTCREIIDSGKLGTIVGANAFMMGGGVETWHPNPRFYYEPGGGPMLDMGPYYLTALINLLGPIKRANGLTRTTYPSRTITSQPFAGQVIEVKTPTHYAAAYEFVNGAVLQAAMSFDVPVHSMPNIIVYGSEGTLIVPDPNNFGGEPQIRTKSGTEWETVPVVKPHTENSRGLGVIDLVRSIHEGRPARASGSLALHVLEAMLAPETSSVTGQTVVLKTTCSRPDPL